MVVVNRAPTSKFDPKLKTLCAFGGRTPPLQTYTPRSPTRVIKIQMNHFQTEMFDLATTSRALTTHPSGTKRIFQILSCGTQSFIPHLGESNLGRVYAEALAAHVESVFADQAVLIGAHAAVASTLSVLLGVRVYQSLGTHCF